MVTTRGPSKSLSPPAQELGGKKRSAGPENSEDSPVKKRGRPTKKQNAVARKPSPKKQTTIEETINVDTHQDEGSDEVHEHEKLPRGHTKKETKDVGRDLSHENSNQQLSSDALEDVNSVDDDERRAKPTKDGFEKSEDSKKEEDAGSKEKYNSNAKHGKKNDLKGTDSNDSSGDKIKGGAEKEQASKTESNAENNESVIEDPKRQAAIPSSILEKGIIYFFFRGRVGIEDPQGIEDVARSYIVLRPLPIGARLGEGPLEDSSNARLLALPKKMLPKSHQDRFLMFVEKVKSSIKDLRDQFAGNEYATKTSGTRNTPAATPFAEGVYCITSTGRESHLAYQITVPSKIGEVQSELGLHEKGSFVLSVKNPETPGPANATIDNPAKYSEALQKKFRNLRWMPLEPEHLDYEGTQFLVIGEGLGDFGKAIEDTSKDKKDDSKESSGEEIEKLEEEDHDRVEKLKEDDPVFADLGLSSEGYSKMQTTW